MAPGALSLQHLAVLSLLIERPSYAYELVRRYEQRYGDVLPVAHQAVYRARDSLRERGWIEEIEPAEGPPHTSYRVTADGARGWKAALRDVPTAAPVDLIVRLLAAAVAGPAAILAVLDSYEEETLAEATRLPPAPPDAHPSDDLVALVEQLIVEERRLEIGSRLKWIQQARRELRLRDRRSGERRT